MKKILHCIFIVAALAALAALGGCKTTEANYRAAYDKAVAGRDSAMQFDQTVYGNQRRAIDSRLVTTDAGDSADVRTMRVAVIVEGGGLNEWLKAYNVVVGQFKQQINAVSMRERLVEAGYPRAFVVETPEPYYYVVLESMSSAPDAIHACHALKSDKKFPFPLRAPLPFLIKVAGMR